VLLNFCEDHLSKNRIHPIAMGNPLSKKDSYFKKDISTQILKTTDFTIFLGKQSIQSLKLNKLFHNHRNRTKTFEVSSHG
jgi:hypothetical protein